jgi:putative DNA primase/helicase
MAVWPDPIKRKVIDQAPNLEARARAKEVFQRFKDMPTLEDGKPTKWRFSTEAQPIFIEWLEENEAETSSGQLHPIIEGHLGKYPKLVAGLSLIFTLIDKPEAELIGQAEIIRAIAFAKYLRTHAERIYSAAVIPEMNGSRSLLEKIKSGKMVIQDELVDRFSSRQLARKGWAGLTIPDHATKAADMLVDYGYLKKLIIPTSEKGGRPTDIYVIHPSIMEEVKNVK